MARVRSVRTALLGVCLACTSGAQVRQNYAAARPIAASDVADTYAIYSELLPGNVIEWGEVPRSVWLIEEASKAVPLGAACLDGGMMNPHQSIRAPENRRTELQEVLADFDARCHDRYTLEAARFHLRLPVRLLDEAARDRFMQAAVGFVPPANDMMRAPVAPDEFKGAAGMHSFTAVYFNRAHTLAMTQIGMYCGGLCGNWSWAVLERTFGGVARSAVATHCDYVVACL